jgi:hypothetical protein
MMLRMAHLAGAGRILDEGPMQGGWISHFRSNTAVAVQAHIRHGLSRPKRGVAAPAIPAGLSMRADPAQKVTLDGIQPSRVEHGITGDDPGDHDQHQGEQGTDQSDRGEATQSLCVHFSNVA